VLEETWNSREGSILQLPERSIYIFRRATDAVMQFSTNKGDSGHDDGDNIGVGPKPADCIARVDLEPDGTDIIKFVRELADCIARVDWKPNSTNIIEPVAEPVECITRVD